MAGEHYHEIAECDLARQAARYHAAFHAGLDERRLGVEVRRGRIDDLRQHLAGRHPVAELLAIEQEAAGRAVQHLERAELVEAVGAMLGRRTLDAADAPQVAEEALGVAV